MENKGYSKLAYILCALFLGSFGIHSFIAKKPIQGILFILTTIIGWLTVALIIGGVILFIEGIVIIIQIIMAASKPSDQYGNIK
jgi:hypothetical protein